MCIRDRSNFAKFEAIQADHKVTAASAVKYGGVLEALALSLIHI